jgi:YD repeat-containing protein
MNNFSNDKQTANIRCQQMWDKKNELKNNAYLYRTVQPCRAKASLISLFVIILAAIGVISPAIASTTDLPAKITYTIPSENPNSPQFSTPTEACTYALEKSGNYGYPDNVYDIVGEYPPIYPYTKCSFSFKSNSSRYTALGMFSIHDTCPDGYLSERVTYTDFKCTLVRGNKYPDSCDTTGNPIYTAYGNKLQREIDYTETSSSNLRLDRLYRSALTSQMDISHLSTNKSLGSFGVNWVHSYSRAINFVSNSTLSAVYAYRPDGRMHIFRPSVNGWIPDADISDKITELKDTTSGSTIGWQYTIASTNEVENYDSKGLLISIKARTGEIQTLTYSTNTRNVLLIRVTDHYGRQLNFTYDSFGRISSMTDPADNITRYSYDASGNLSTVTYPDDTPADLSNNPKKTYIYGELANTANVSQPNALTGIIDENGVRFATFKYAANRFAISTEHANGVEKYSLVYTFDALGKRITNVTDPLGSVRTTYFTTVLGVMKSTGTNQPGGSGCSAASSAITYDANSNVSSRTDFNGNRTNYRYDLTRNLETSRTEGLTKAGAATPATRTITTLWHPAFRLPVQITNGNQQTTYVYNSQGDLTDKTVKDTATNTARSWHTTYTYSSVPGVLLQKVEDGPRTDVADLTTYDYYPSDAACTGGHLGCRGQLKQLTDALGHVTQLDRYNAHGQVEQLTDPNGLVTTLAYDLRQRLVSFDSGGETTTYTYDPAGQLTRITRPDGAYLEYSYDAAHRLIKTQDNLGNTLVYTLDALGNRIKEEAHDPNGQLARTQSRVYDALSRLQNLILPQ